MFHIVSVHFDVVLISRLKLITVAWQMDNNVHMRRASALVNKPKGVIVGD